MAIFNRCFYISDHYMAIHASICGFDENCFWYQFSIMSTQ